MFVISNTISNFLSLLVVPIELPLIGLRLHLHSLYRAHAAANDPGNPDPATTTPGANQLPEDEQRSSMRNIHNSNIVIYSFHQAVLPAEPPSGPNLIAMLLESV